MLIGFIGILKGFNQPRFAIGITQSSTKECAKKGPDCQGRFEIYQSKEI